MSADPDRPWRAGERVAFERDDALCLGSVVADEAPGDQLLLVRLAGASPRWTFVPTEDLSDPPTTG